MPAIPANSAFKLEREMSSPVSAWIRRQRLAEKQEYVTPWGICDFVAVSFHADRVRQRLDLGQVAPIGPPKRIAVLNSIPDEEPGVTRGFLKNRFSDVSVDYELDYLLKHRFVSQHLSYFRKINGWAPLHKRIVAIELKLSRVQDAIQQAYAHFSFATESYVALPIELATRVANSKRAEVFHTLGVGLMGVGGNDCELIIRSKENPQLLNLVMQMHCTERFWRTEIRDSRA